MNLALCSGAHTPTQLIPSLSALHKAAEAGGGRGRWGQQRALEADRPGSDLRSAPELCVALWRLDPLSLCFLLK